MIPITGITQITSGAGTCSNPFTLTYQQSCTLNLEISGSALQGDVAGGPVVCEQGNHLQCYQPSLVNELHIQRTNSTYTVTPGGDGNETISPNTPQTVGLGTTQQFTVTAHTGYAVNTAVGGTCPQGSWAGSIYTTGAITEDCSVSFSAISLNTTISLGGSPLLLTPNTTGSLTVTNTGSATATEIMATLPPDLAVDVTQDASNCIVLIAGASCYLHFTSNDQSHPPTAITVSGTNTNTAGATITLTVPYITNGSVNAFVLDKVNNIIYLGGAFTQVGPNTGNGVPVDTGSGLAATTFPRVNNDVNSAIADGNGGWYIGGSFTNVGGVTRNCLAHILFDGTLDANWNPNVTAPSVCIVTALALSGNTIYVGGTFTNIGGQARNNIAALDATTGAATGWNPNASSGIVTQVRALTLSGSTIYAGGTFTNIGGQARNLIAALDTTTGAATGWDPNVTGTLVNTLVLSGSTIYIGGEFTNIGLDTRNGIAAVDTATGAATSWDPNPVAQFPTSPSVYALALSSNTIYVGGVFTSIGGEARNNIAELNLSGSGTATTWDPNANNVVQTLTLSGSTIYAGGLFTNIGGETRTYLAALDATTGTASAWNPNLFFIPSATGSVLALSLNGSTIYVGGKFFSIGAQTRNHIAALDATTGLLSNWNPNADNTVNALALSNGTVYAGGLFTSIGGQTRHSIAALDASTGLATSWNPNASGGSPTNVSALTLNDTTVYAGGAFTTIGGQTRTNIAALDASGSALISWLPNANNTVSALALSNGILYAGGSFTVMGGQTRNRIAALDAGTGALGSWNPDIPNNSVLALTVSADGNTVYAGGNFTGLIGGQSRNRIVALNASTGVPTSWNPNANSRVTALALSGSMIYAGGAFTHIGGAARNNLAALDINTGADTGWNPNPNRTVTALALSDSTVYSGGVFTQINELSVSYFAIIPMQLTP